MTLPKDKEGKTMPRLYKFYELINRNALVTLTEDTLTKTYFEGSVKDIPDSYDDWKVTDFCISNQGDFLFHIAK